MGRSHGRGTAQASLLSMRDWPIFEPQTSACDLAPHPYRVALRGQLHQLRQPPLCAFCGAGADRCIPVLKVFRDPGGGDGVTGYCVDTAAVPYCPSCTARHGHERRVLSPIQRVAVSLATGLTVSAVGSVFMAFVLLPAAWRALWMPGFPLPLAVVLAFAAIAASSLAGAWRETARRRVPPQTEVTRAFDFSPTGAPLFGELGFVCSIRNADFARAFVAANQERVRAVHADAVAPSAMPPSPLGSDSRCT